MALHSEPPDHYVLLSHLLDCQSRSQARLCHCTISTMSDVPSVLRAPRYSLGGDRPSQTAYHALSQPRYRAKVGTAMTSGWYFNVGSMRASAPTQSLPPILHRSHHSPMQATVKVHGGLRLAAGRLHHHKHFNFAESQEETVVAIVTPFGAVGTYRQGISLP